MPTHQILHVPDKKVDLIMIAQRFELIIYAGPQICCAENQRMRFMCLYNRGIDTSTLTNNEEFYCTTINCVVNREKFKVGCFSRTNLITGAIGKTHKTFFLRGSNSNFPRFLILPK